MALTGRSSLPESEAMETTDPAPGHGVPGVVPQDWEGRYQRGDIPWDRHDTWHILDRVLREWRIAPGRLLEMGCGTGRTAIQLARTGFRVTAFDVSPLAIARCRASAAAAGVSVDFCVADFRDLQPAGGPFPFLFDSGFYHCVRQGCLPALQTFLARVTSPGSLWLTVAGNDNDPHGGPKGPPRVRASELCAELESLFAVVELRETHFAADDPGGRHHPLAWSALLRRR